MEGYRQSIYGDSYPSEYESRVQQFDPASMVETLARYAGAGPVLELGIGSGRIARPLATRGIEVDGIEVSQTMIEQLNDTRDGLPIRAIQGDFADFEPPRRYSLIYCGYNTFFLLTTREEQMRAFASIERALDDNGIFICETAAISDSNRIELRREFMLPTPHPVDVGQEFKIVRLTADSVTFQFSLHHADRQTIETQRVVLDAKGATLHPCVLRYALLDELDEMAARSGLHLQTRWANWDAEPFTHKSYNHVSIYARHD